MLTDSSNKMLALIATGSLGVVDVSRAGVASETTLLTLPEPVERLIVNPATGAVLVTAPLSSAQQLFGQLDTSTGAVTTIAALSVHIESTGSIHQEHIELPVRWLSVLTMTGGTVCCRHDVHMWNVVDVARDHRSK